MPASKLKAFLDQNNVPHTTLSHWPAFAAPEVASSAHIPIRNFAKTVIVCVDETPTMIVLPASRRVLLHELREMLENTRVRLATEHELRELFPDCEVGAMPPFGVLYGMKTYVDAKLAHEKEIAFNAGTHTEVIRIKYDDFDRLVKPLIVDWVTA